MISPTTKTAIVLFNLGGPDAPESVQPFLFNLFNDPAIIRLPVWFRTPLAKFISKRRAPKAQKIYAELGGKSPLLENTIAQAEALESALKAHGNAKVFIAMRYWKPFADETAHQVKDYRPDSIILLPLYPQFSTTTTGSSFADWDRAAASIGLNAPTKKICCYPAQKTFIAAHAQLIKSYYEQMECSIHLSTEVPQQSPLPQRGRGLGEGELRTGEGASPQAQHTDSPPHLSSPPLGERDASLAPRILFSAHGLPEKVIKKGDPYQWQVEQTTQAVVSALASLPPSTPLAGGRLALSSLDYVNCYQSRVGPMKWIGPSTEDEIARAGAEKKPILLVPIAFVSEHSETLVELDIEYAHLAKNAGVPHYVRVPTLSVQPHFIASLAEICLNAKALLAPDTGKRICGKEWGVCLCRC